MPWKLCIWFGYCSGVNGNAFDSPGLSEDVESRAAGKSRALEVLADGYTVEDDGEYHHFPASAVSHIKLYEYEEEE